MLFTALCYSAFFFVAVFPGLPVATAFTTVPGSIALATVATYFQAELTINILRAGIEGMVYKFDKYEEVVTAITSVLRTGIYFSESVKDIVKRNTRSWDDIPSVVLSPRERDFLKALANGLTTSEIAPLFKMSEAYAEKYRRVLVKKWVCPTVRRCWHLLSGME
jgi:DNA-binding NarL/FixJ family response regulator